MNSKVSFRVTLAAVAIQALIGVPASAEHLEKNVRELSITKDTKADELELFQGFSSVIPLDFVPTVASVGDPNVLGMEVVGGGKTPHLMLVGLAPGATNLIVFDESHNARIVMEVTVDPRKYGSVDKVSIYRQTTLEDVICTEGQCEKIKK